MNPLEFRPNRRQAFCGVGAVAAFSAAGEILWAQDEKDVLPPNALLDAFDDAVIEVELQLAQVCSSDLELVEADARRLDAVAAKIEKALSPAAAEVKDPDVQLALFGHGGFALAEARLAEFGPAPIKGIEVPAMLEVKADPEAESCFVVMLDILLKTLGVGDLRVAAQKVCAEFGFEKAAAEIVDAAKQKQFGLAAQRLRVLLSKLTSRPVLNAFRKQLGKAAFARLVGGLGARCVPLVGQALLVGKLIVAIKNNFGRLQDCK